MSSLLFGLEVTVVFLVMVCVLVAAHEYGHYLFARLFGMGVEEFAIGMGKKLKVLKRKEYDVPVPADYRHEDSKFSEGSAFEGGKRESKAVLVDTPTGRVLRDETEFTVRLLPIGGFVRIKGMVPDEEGSETRIPGGFYSKAPWKRLIVLVAGPVFSVLAGMVLFMGLFMTDGVTKPLNKPILGVVNDVAPNRAAYDAGLRQNDEIVSIAGKPVTTFYDLVQVVQTHPNQDLALTYRRAGAVASTVVHPTLSETYRFAPDMTPGMDTHMAGVLGVKPPTIHRRLSLGEAAGEVWTIPGQAVEGLVRLVKRPSRIQKEAGGAVSMVQMTSEATKQGLGSLIALAAIISISVGFFNLLPIPPLDGGQMIMALAEMLRGGKRLSLQVQSLVTSAGVVAILTLAVLFLFIDVKRISDTPKPAQKPAASQPQR